MIETSSDLLRPFSAIFRYLRKMSGNLREIFGNVRLAFRSIQVGSSEILGRSPQTPLCIVNLLQKTKDTWSLGDTGISLLVLKNISLVRCACS